MESMEPGSTFPAQPASSAQSPSTVETPRFPGSKGFDISGWDGVRRNVPERVELLASALNQAAVGVATIAGDGKLLWANGAYAAFLGRPLLDLRKLRFTDVLEPEDVAPALAGLERVARGELARYQRDCRHSHATGKWVWGSLSLAAVRDSRGRLKHLLMVLKDLTREKNLEELVSRHEARILACSKMSSLGEMSSAIAHEINNPLAIIHAKAGQICRMASRGNLSIPEVRAISEKIRETAMRISRIVRSLSFIARESDGDPFLPVPLRQIVEDTLELCQDRFRFRGVHLEMDPIPEGLTLECRGVQLCQVLVNLLNNACDAIGQLIDSRIHLGISDQGETVRISVTDSGSGIPPEIRQRIFEPFFTTKGIGKGTGIGLSVARDLVEAHQGTLRLDNDSPHTRFIMEIPKLQARQSRHEPHA